MASRISDWLRGESSISRPKRIDSVAWMSEASASAIATDDWLPWLTSGGVGDGSSLVSDFILVLGGLVSEVGGDFWLYILARIWSALNEPRQPHPLAHDTSFNEHVGETSTEKGEL